jgi:hypothetical protein
MPIHVIQDKISLDELLEEVAKLQKVSRYLLNGQIDFENIRARSIKAVNIETETITTNELAANSVSTDKLQAGSVVTDKLAAGAVTADKITVDELSAISADMGKITAGEIYGAYIATSEGVAPFIEFSSTTTLLKAWADALNTMAIIASVTGSPSLVMSDGTNSGYLTFAADFTGTKKTTLGGESGVVISSGDHVDFDTGLFNVRVQSWNNFVARSPSGQTLQAALDGKKNAGGGFTGAIPPGSTIFVTDGEITGYM